MDNKDNAKITAMQIRRQILIQYSGQARTIKAELQEKATLYESLRLESLPLNHFIVNHIYKKDNPDLEFKTFHEWKKEGATIIKGSKAYAVWGQPKRGQKALSEGAGTTPPASPVPQPTANGNQANPQGEDMSEYEFYPICLLFSSEQVFFKTQKAEGNDPDQAENPESYPLGQSDSKMNNINDLLS